MMQLFNNNNNNDYEYYDNYYNNNNDENYDNNNNNNYNNNDYEYNNFEEEISKKWKSFIKCEKEIERNKCYYHIELSYFAICKQCKEPICHKCMLGKHNGHIITELQDQNQSDLIVKEFALNFPEYYKDMKINKTVFKESLKRKLSKQEEFKEQKETIKTIFCTIYSFLNQSEKNFIEEIEKKEIEVSIIHESIENGIKGDRKLNESNKIVKSYKNNHENILLDSSPQKINHILQHNQYLKEFSKNKKEINKINEESLYKYNDINIPTGCQLRKCTIQMLESIDLIAGPKLKYQNVIIYINQCAKIYVGLPIEKDVQNVALNHTKINPLFSPFKENNIRRVIVMDGCNNFEVIPSSVKFMLLLEYRRPIDRKEIPESIENLGFGNGFVQKVTHDLIPLKIELLEFGDILEPLTKESIPSLKSLKTITFTNDYGHEITGGVIPNTVENVYLWKIKKPINEKSIPNGVEKLVFREGYPHKIRKYTIPKSVLDLYFHNIKESPDYKSIGTGVLQLHFCNNYSHFISPGLIPNNVKELFLYNITKNLGVGSISPGIISLVLLNGFKHEIKSGIIPNTVKELTVFNIGKKLTRDSISPGIKCLSFLNGYGHYIAKGDIPDTVEELYIANIDQQLESGSIPNGVKSLMFCNGYKHKIPFGVIPESVTDLYLAGIEQQLELDSIPYTVERVHLCNGFMMEIRKNIYPFDKTIDYRCNF